MHPRKSLPRDGLSQYDRTLHDSDHPRAGSRKNLDFLFGPQGALKAGRRREHEGSRSFDSRHVLEDGLRPSGLLRPDVVLRLCAWYPNQVTQPNVTSSTTPLAPSCIAVLNLQEEEALSQFQQGATHQPIPASNEPHPHPSSICTSCTREFSLPLNSPIPFIQNDRYDG